ncbi:intracellular proteinase inhibitor (BsuPI) [Neobacillus notoginsengisoli]|uniref:Intracellular proteinase inhibitor (BsuPI) n=1 Tax=Neobacillus notoginsengisoli TaxID=1578198 RepID=A0A417YQA7_9BACI|nr:BsuPI-related putative proteinase inhibitor [Neobacillus notoginsengisoli]RHW35743.1 intracellular proteinase inhibitor (BsuPI) [Neobacillus notoginsengisoli]
MKKILLILLLGTLVTGCGTANEAPVDKPAQKVNGGGKGIVANEVKATLTEISPLVFQYELNNQTEEAVNLEFSSSQRVDYSVMDKDGNEVFLFSSAALFAQVMGKETILQGDTFNYEINLHELNLQKGDYTLTAWMTPRNGQQYKASEKFTVE